MGIGVLLPRDFLDRQPKRWQKSQRKRGAIKTLKRMKEKREKLEQKTLDHARRDSKYSSVEAAPAKHDLKPAPAAATAPAPAPAEALALASSCTPFGDREQGFWAAQLAPNRPLVVRIPDGAQLWLLHAALPDGADGSPGPVLLRSRVPASQAVSTLCALQPGQHESCRLSACFSSEDRQCALGAEGDHPLHLVGCYKRPATAAETAAAAAAAASSSAASSAAAAKPPSRPAPPPAAARAPAAASGASTAGGLREMRAGLKVVDTTAGKKGREARSGDRLSVRYKGLTTDAQGNWFEFDSNRGKPLHFVLGEGEVIQGWELGIVGMRCGGTRRLIVPPALGYGDRGAGKIRPGATLVFEVTLQNIQ